jgi:hypothetical protein
MHPMTHDGAARARIADWHRQAERDRVARTARHVRKAHRRRAVPDEPATGFARRVLAVLGARSLRPPVSAQGRAPKATS